MTADKSVQPRFQAALCIFQLILANKCRLRNGGRTSRSCCGWSSVL